MAQFVLPGPRIQRDPLSGSPQIGSAPQKPCIIGRSDGELVLITSESELKGAKGSLEALTNTPVSGIIAISDTNKGIADYVSGRDYRLTNDRADWSLNSVVTPPAQITPVVSQTGGTLTAATRYYVVTTIRVTDITQMPNTIGETTRSNEVTCTTTTSTGKNDLQWKKSVGAAGYRVYRTTTPGTYPDGAPYGPGSLVTTILGGDNTTFTDDGSISPLDVGAPPASNDAWSQPATGATYYVSYRYRVFDYSPHFFTSLADIRTKYGLSSDIAKAAKLLMGRNGLGNDAPATWVVAAQDDSDAAYEIAFDKLAGKDIQLIGATRASYPLAIYGLAHAVDQSDPLNKRERRVLMAAPAGTPIGDDSTSGTLLYEANALKNMRISWLGSKGTFKASMEQLDGSLASEDLSPAFAMIAVMGRIVSLPDPAEPITNKEINGFDPANPMSDEYLESEHLFLIQGGVMTIENQGGRLLVKQGVTTDNETIENFEISVGLAEDELRRMLRSGSQRFVGRKLTTGLIRAFTTTIKQILSAAVKVELIASFNEGTLDIHQDSVRKTFLDVKFSYEPIYPLNVPDFVYSFDLGAAGTSGQTQ